MDGGYTYEPIRLFTPIRAIAQEVAEKHGLTLPEIFGRSLARHVTRARQEAYYRAAKEKGCGQSEIARVFNKCDHTAVGYGIKAHAKRLKLEEQAREAAVGTP